MISNTEIRLSIILKICLLSFSQLGVCRIAGRTLKASERGQALSPKQLFQLLIRRRFGELFLQAFGRYCFAKQDGDISDKIQRDIYLNKLRYCSIYSLLISQELLYSYQLYNANLIRLLTQSAAYIPIARS